MVQSAATDIWRKRRPVRKYIAIQEWYETEETTPHYYAIFDSQITDFYSWTISKNGKLIIGSALILKGMQRKI